MEHLSTYINERMSSGYYGDSTLDSLLKAPIIQNVMGVLGDLQGVGSSLGEIKSLYNNILNGDEDDRDAEEKKKNKIVIDLIQDPAINRWYKKDGSKFELYKILKKKMSQRDLNLIDDVADIFMDAKR